MLASRGAVAETSMRSEQPQRLPRLSTADRREPGRTPCNYLRAAQAYMLISMPTGTSTIFGVFQDIWVS